MEISEPYSDGVSGEKVRFEPELDHQVGNEQKYRMEHFPIFIDNNQHAEFDKQPIVDQNGLMYTCSAICERKSTYICKGLINSKLFNIEPKHR